VASHREHDVTAGPRELDGQLLAGRSRADDHHATGWERVRPPVVAGVQLVDGRGQITGERGHARTLVRPRGHHHLAGLPRAAVGLDDPAGAGRTRGVHRGVLHDRGVEGAGVVLEERHDPVTVEEPVGVVTRVPEAGQPGVPVGGEEVERVPPFAAPAFGGAPTLQQHVVDADGGEAAAEREAGVPRADDDGRGVASHGRASHDRAAETAA
jgi:hypothetical protein